MEDGSLSHPFFYLCINRKNSKMYRTAALKALREKLSAMNISAIIIPTNDPHFGEYTQDHYKVREWLSGFNGSAGTLVVTMKGAALWTDSRYFCSSQYN